MCVFTGFIARNIRKASSKFYSFIKSKRDKYSKMIREDKDSDSSESMMSLPELPQDDLEIKINSKTRMPVSKPLLFLSIICLLTPAYSQCSDSPTQLSSFPVCSYDGVHANCQVSFSIRSVLQFVNATSCYNVKDNLGNLLGSLKLKYLYQKSVSTAKFLYYTSGYYGLIEAHNGCYEDAWCGDRCNNVDINDFTGIGQMNSPWRYCIGETSCLREASAAQCWSTKDKCYVRRWMLMPDNVSEVHNFDSISHSFLVSMTFESDNSTYSKNFTMSYLAQSTDTNFTLQLEGSYSPLYQIPIPSIGLINNYAGTRTYKYHSYSPVNSPVLGSLGEIQTSVLNQLSCPTDGSSRNIRKSPGIFTWTGRSSGSFTNPAVNLARPFPYVAAGLTWSFAGPSSLYTYPSVVNPIAVVLSTFTPINITKTVSVVCPKALAANATGYYKHTSGYTVTFTAYSTCSAGDILVSSVNCVEVPFTITTAPLKYTITCYSGNETVSEELHIRSSVSNSTLAYTAVLEFKTDFVNNTVDTGTVVGSKSKSDSLSNKFKSFFLDGISGFSTGLSSFLNGLINSMLIIVYVFIFIAIMYYASKFILNRLVNKMNSPPPQKESLLQTKDNSTAKYTKSNRVQMRRNTKTGKP